jgi:hypothetical protein
MFVQIGNRAFRDDAPDFIKFSEGSVSVFFASGTEDVVIFDGPEAEAFLDWWYNKADVYLYTKEEEPIVIDGCPAGFEVGVRVNPTCRECPAFGDCSLWRLF